MKVGDMDKCPKCGSYGGCVCHKLQFWNRVLSFLRIGHVDFMCHYCGHEWSEKN